LLARAIFLLFFTISALCKCLYYKMKKIALKCVSRWGHSWRRRSIAARITIRRLRPDPTRPRRLLLVTRMRQPTGDALSSGGFLLVITCTSVSMVENASKIDEMKSIIHLRTISTNFRACALFSSSFSVFSKWNFAISCPKI
jgi:hypothetical protein